MGIEYKSKDKCRLVVYAGTDAYGKPQRFIRTVTYTSKRNAEKQYREFENEVENGLRKESRIKLSEMMDGYISSRKRKGLKSNSIRGYEIIKARILKTLGDPYAEKVTRKMIDDWIGRLDEQGCAAKTIKHSVTFLSSCYERYIDLEVLVKNPCRKADIPNKPAREHVVLTHADLPRFYAALCQEKEDQLDFVVAIELMLFLGLRRSEVCGIRVTDIDLLDRTIHVQDARHRIDGHNVTEGTKTIGSNRVLSLPALVYADIRALIALHDERSLADENLPEPVYLILGDSGEPIHPSVIYTRLKRLEKKHGLPDVNCHELRHTYASMLKWSGRDLIEISKQLGHTQTSTTLNIYTHLFKDVSIASREIADDIDSIMGISKTQFTPNSHLLTIKNAET